jgi:hypothetical protein
MPPPVTPVAQELHRGEHHQSIPTAMNRWEKSM